MMVCVIADDITGAAEMGGIARRLGLSVCLSLDGHIREDCDVAVIATDTRSMTEEEAVYETRRVTSDLKEERRIKAFFKKTDSALRGHVVAELSVMMEILDREGALYLPANPTKKRVISDGRYLIDGVPIDETAVSFDPDFPAFSSRVSERFPD
ncbi:MAG: four-carbon acid sugar kinase family protein, partial [Muribaculaceae bacterium]|nr:four-carbon acid sugar kinase family protein [Muribaculaceae bacterium]